MSTSAPTPALRKVPRPQPTSIVLSAWQTSLCLLWLPRSYRSAAAKPRGGQSAHRHDEQARKPQQHLAVIARRIGLGDACLIVGEEGLARIAVERVKERPQRRALEPLDDRLRPRHHVIVDDVPDIEMAGERPQQIIV